MKIAVDAMGGDYAPKEIVAGVELARDQFNDIEFLLFGKKDEVMQVLNDETNITVIDCSEVIDMNDEPVRAIRRKKDSSLVKAAMAVKSHDADAIFSCGNTGALLAAGLLIVGRIKGIARPGLLSTLPVLTADGTQASFNLLDSGANADNKPEQLYQYALLGRLYAQSVRGIENPRIGLLNNGTEPHKGSKLTLEAHKMIAADDTINFVGNVESRDVLTGPCDVLVADGFTGNAVLKSIEGTAKATMNVIKSEIMQAGPMAKLGALMLKPAFANIKAKMDQSQYGGAVLLGAKAPVVKAHGASDAKTVLATIKQIKEMIDHDMLQKFEQAVAVHNEQTNSND